MKLNFQYILAAGLLVIIGLWFFINSASGKAPTPSGEQDSQAATAVETPKVQIITVSAQNHPTIYSLYGRTEAAREVQIKAETSGRIVSTPAKEGRMVKRGQLVCRQDVDARAAQLDQARANLSSVETDLNAARILAEKGYQSATRVTAIEAQLDGARAAVKQAEIELANVNITAPFDGIWERQIAETGDWLAPGQPCGLLVELSPLIVVVQLSETQLVSIGLGSEAEVELATGETLTGKVELIEAKADPATRTFRTEVHLPNPDMSLKAGVTATVKLRAGETLAQQIPANVLTLDTNGSVGVRYLDSGDIVRFARTTTIDEEDGGIWVTGLPEQTRVIVQGQDFVSIGTEVEPVAASTRAAQ